MDTTETTLLSICQFNFYPNIYSNKHLQLLKKNLNRGMPIWQMDVFYLLGILGRPIPHRPFTQVLSPCGSCRFWPLLAAGFSTSSCALRHADFSPSPMPRESNSNTRSWVVAPLFLESSRARGWNWSQLCIGTWEPWLLWATGLHENFLTFGNKNKH